jgi:hypothetical protein
LTSLVDYARPNIPPARVADARSTISRLSDVHQQRDVTPADLGHVGIEKIAVVEAGALALIDVEAKMVEDVALRLDDAWVDVVPIERNDAVHFRLGRLAVPTFVTEAY